MLVQLFTHFVYQLIFSRFASDVRETFYPTSDDITAQLRFIPCAAFHSACFVTGRVYASLDLFGIQLFAAHGGDEANRVCIRFQK